MQIIRHRLLLSLLILFVFAGLITNKTHAQLKSIEYILGPQDVIEIKVWDNLDLNAKAVVTLDGNINYYMIGQIKVSGLSPAQLADKITNLLSDGYLVNPQVTVEVLEYKSQKIVISGEVVKPGSYYLTKKTSIVEAIAMAGGETKDADNEIFLIRNALNNTNVENIEINKQANKKVVDLIKAQEGDLRQNIFIKSGDYIFVPKAKTFFILGEVKKPGKYNLKFDTTVIKAISLAGGETEKASMSRIKVIRVINGEKSKKSIDINDTVKPDDIIIIPESFF